MTNKITEYVRGSASHIVKGLPEVGQLNFSKLIDRPIIHQRSTHPEKNNVV